VARAFAVMSSNGRSPTRLTNPSSVPDFASGPLEGLSVGSILGTYVHLNLMWTCQTVSQLGSQVTLVALPRMAIPLLDATPLQLAL